MKQKFFPDAAFHDEVKRDQFVVNWYSRHLESLREPSLYALANDSASHVYRFLWLRTFHQPVSVRLNITSEGCSQITGKVTDGQGGYHPGKLVFEETSALTSAQSDSFLARIERLDFWNLPTQTPERGIQLDGADWILEGVQNGAYHVLRRWSPGAGAFRESALMLTQLVEITVREVY